MAAGGSVCSPAAGRLSTLPCTAAVAQLLFHHLRPLLAAVVQLNCRYCAACALPANFAARRPALLQLHFGNLVYLYLTVAFIQMLKVSTCAGMRMRLRVWASRCHTRQCTRAAASRHAVHSSAAQLERPARGCCRGSRLPAAGP